MSVQENVRELSGMLRVGQAAQLMGVSAETLRNWDRAGWLIPTRHPVTGYRYYNPTDLERFLEKIVKERGRG